MVVNYSKSKAQAKEVIAEIGSSGGRAIEIQADVTLEGSGIPFETGVLTLDDSVLSIGLKKRYVEKFEAKLPSKTVARYFQLENKFEAIVAADLARQIPLVP